ncbi:MAG: hypothetical protein HQ523_03375 [Lentisphaerae bacterium]|nr:hypothetical protein [Lentisphaerota bacterium]
MLDDFLRVLNGETPEQIPWTADLSYWISGQKQAGKADAAWDSEEGYLQLHYELGVIPYYYYPRFWVGEPRYDESVTVAVTRRKATTQCTWTTPVGTLTETRAFMAESACEGVTRHPVSTPEDLNVLTYLIEHRHMEPVHLSDYRERCDLWAQYDGLPCLGLPRSGLPALCYEWTGLENFVYLMMDCETQVRALLDLMEEQEVPIIEAVCELAPPLVHFPDNLSSENLTGYYDDLLGPQHRHRLAALHRAGIKAAVHLDGTVRGLLPKLIDAGFDAVEALTPAPVGDMSLKEIESMAKDSATILWGGMPGALFAAPWTWSDVEAHLEAFRHTWGTRPAILGVADQVPPDGDIEFIRRIGASLRR